MLRAFALRPSPGRARLLPALAVLAVFAACGPTESTAVIIDADVELEAARAAGASKTAPYEYTAAEAYLHKAREEAGYADYQPAVTFARKARDFAKAAKAKALAASNRPTEAQ